MTAISLFSGAMGLDLGFERAGFEVRVTLELRKEVCDTIRLNRPNIPVINEDITKVTTDEILAASKLRPGESTVLVGGPPCQSFSTAGKRQSINEKRGLLVFEYMRVVNQAQPRFFVFENVTGLLNAALQHISFEDRMKAKPEDVAKEAQLGTAFAYVLKRFRRTGYALAWKVLNAADYGAPQKRQRLFIFGSRLQPAIAPPSPTHDRPDSLAVASRQRKPWVTLREALVGLKEDEQEYVEFPVWGEYMKYVPPGGYWRDLPDDIKKQAMKGAFFSSGGRTGFYRRLSWDTPCPTLVTSPVFKGSCLAHPDANRPLSVQEYSRIQGFPDTWKFCGNLMQRYRMIGEAVPVKLAEAVASAVMARAKSDAE
jgi:DNA (cytosine-5)-methyltransferase 1